MINETNLFAWFQPQTFAVYREWTGPFLRIHDEQRRRRPSEPWPWDIERASATCVDRAWDMTGAWRARRGVRVDRVRFTREVPAVAAQLAEVLNRNKITNLRQLCEVSASNRAAYEEVVAAVHDAVKAASAIKPTAVLKPMFGSKVLHHYFPSVVPVFDSAYVHRGVMRSSDFANYWEFERASWRCFSYERDGEDVERDAELDLYFDYFDYCLLRLSEVSAGELQDLRVRFADVFSPCVNPWIRGDRSSLLWQLDAKIVEWCLCGGAHLEGVL